MNNDTDVDYYDNPFSEDGVEFAVNLLYDTESKLPESLRFNEETSRDEKLTPFEESIKNLWSDLTNSVSNTIEIVDSLIEGTKNELADRLRELVPDKYQDDVQFWENQFEIANNTIKDFTSNIGENWSELSPNEQAAIIIDVLTVASLPFGETGATGIILTARVSLAAAITGMITKLEANNPLTKTGWTEASEIYFGAHAAAERVSYELPQLGLKSPAALDQMSAQQLNSELYRLGKLPKSTFTEIYQSELQQRISTVGSKTPTTDPSLAAVNERINNPPQTPETNTAVVVSNKVVSSDSLAGNPISVVGSRNIPPEHQDQVNRIAAALDRAGCQITTGCATGVDAAMAQYATKIKAQFGPNGQGAVSAVSNIKGVKDAAARGAEVEYFAGGNLDTPVNYRLFNRANSIVDDTNATLGILTKDVSVGTMNSLKRAAKNGNTVYAISLNGGKLPPLNPNGHWQIVENAKGIWKVLMKWVSDQLF